MILRARPDASPPGAVRIVDAVYDDLLEGLEGDAREARRKLLNALSEDGCSEQELRDAVAEDRLVMLPVERVLAQEGKYTAHEMAEKLGLDREVLRAGRRAFGLPVPGDGEKAYGDQDLAIAQGLKATLESGVPAERIIELNRIIGRSMAQVAAASRAMVTETFLKPGATELDVGIAAARAAEELAPQMAPVLAFAYEAHLRELLRSDVISSADIAAGRTPGARDMAVAFADLVGFTRLGEQVEAEELGGVAAQLEALADEHVEAPVTLVKTIGDALFLVSPDSKALLASALDLVEAADAIGEEFPQLRVGVACGPALERAGDWYGSPVNTASRLTEVARPGSVLATEKVKETAEDAVRWRFAGDRKLKGVGTVKLFRARRADGARGDAEDG